MGMPGDCPTTSQARSQGAGVVISVLMISVKWWVRVVVLVTVFWVMMVRGQGGLGGLPGQRVSRTGDTWPPYPGAGLDVWACKAGFYGHSSDCSRFEVYLESFRRTTADFRSSPQMILLW